MTWNCNENQPLVLDYNLMLFGSTIRRVHFGLRGWKEHGDMCWGDVQEHYQTTNVEEFLEYTERQTKTQTKTQNSRDVRQRDQKKCV